MLDSQTKKIADSVLLLAIARISMVLSLPALTFIAWMGGQWLDQKFQIQDAKITSQAETASNQSTLLTSRIETVERNASARIETVEKTAGIAVDEAGKVNSRLTVVETKQTQGDASSERFQTATLQRLDRMQDSIVSMSNAIAALTAILQSEHDKNRNNN